MSKTPFIMINGKKIEPMKSSSFVHYIPPEPHIIKLPQTEKTVRFCRFWLSFRLREIGNRRASLESFKVMKELAEDAISDIHDFVSKHQRRFEIDPNDPDPLMLEIKVEMGP